MTTILGLSKWEKTSLNERKSNFYPTEDVTLVVYTHTWDCGRLDTKK